MPVIDRRRAYSTDDPAAVAALLEAQGAQREFAGGINAAAARVVGE